MRGDWKFGLSWGQGPGKVAVAVGLIAAFMLLPRTAVHADSSTTVSVDAKAGPFAHFNKGLSNGNTIDPSGSGEPVDTHLKVTATTTNIRITYTGGTITLFSPDPSRNPAFTPDGRALGDNSLPFGIPKATTPVPLPSARYAQLLYRIGPADGGTIGVVFAASTISGNSVDIVPPSGKIGELYLFINDTQYYDNDGAYNVDVALADASGTGTGGGIHADGTATPEAPAGLLLALGMLPLAGVVAWRRKRMRS